LIDMQDSLSISGSRAAACAIAVASLGALGALLQFGATEKFADEFPDPLRVIRQQERLEPVLVNIPVTGRVGYFSDMSLEDPIGQASFFAVQYAVAPRIAVLPGARVSAEWWIGSFSKQMDDEAFRKEGAKYGLEFTQSLGNSVGLFHKGAR
jgi:hypothetical protein